MDKENLVTVTTDLMERNRLLQELFLYAVGLRDIHICESSFSEIKDINIRKITDANKTGSLYTFIISYGRLHVLRVRH